MTLNADNYRVNIPIIDAFLKDKTQDERVQSIGKLAIMTGVPIVIVTVYIIELYGIDSQLHDKLIQLIYFYKITDIINSTFIRIIDSNIWTL